MTREQQLREARRLLSLPHPAADDDVTKALQYIEFRNHAFLATKRRLSKPIKRAAHSFSKAMARASKAGLAEPPSSWFLICRDVATATSGPPKRADGVRKRFALHQAYHLLNDRNRPCLASRNGDWCRLAAILYGNPKADMLSQCRQIRKIMLGPSE
jgi:hypothetical protein